MVISSRLRRLSSTARRPEASEIVLILASSPSVGQMAACWHLLCLYAVKPGQLLEAPGEAPEAHQSFTKVCNENKNGREARAASSWRLPGRLRKHSNPLLKFVLKTKKWPGGPGSSWRLPGRLRKHSNPLLKFVLKTKNGREARAALGGSRGGSGSTAILY